MKKKILITILCIACLLIACSGESKKAEVPDSQTLLTELKEKSSNVGDIQTFSAEDDPNEKLGRPGYYISKADFSDTRLEQGKSEYLAGGTIETFQNQKDCDSRAKYLGKLNDSSMGVLALNQYIYQYDKVLFRVTYDLTQEQAEEYHTLMNEIMEQYQ